jgi:hypothetical protein
MRLRAIAEHDEIASKLYITGETIIKSGGFSLLFPKTSHLSRNTVLLLRDWTYVGCQLHPPTSGKVISIRESSPV